MRNALGRAALVAGVGVLILGWAGPAPAAGAAVQLTATTAQATYRPGAPVAVRLVVRQQTGKPCALNALADGSIRVVRATRDGVALAPSYARALPLAGSAVMVARHRRLVEPGAPVDIDLELGGATGLTLLTPARSGPAVRRPGRPARPVTTASTWSTRRHR